jgi:excisionase family DNA binding protein
VAVRTFTPVRTANPLLVSIAEASFQLSLSKEDVGALIHEGELTAVSVRGQVLVVYDSLIAFARRVKRNSTVLDLLGDDAK